MIVQYTCVSLQDIKNEDTRLTFKIAEELQDASITMPKAIMWTVGPNAAFGFLMAITLCFTVGPDLTAIRDTPIGQPFIQVYFKAILFASVMSNVS